MGNGPKSSHWRGNKSDSGMLESEQGLNGSFKHLQSSSWKPVYEREYRSLLSKVHWSFCSPRWSVERKTTGEARRPRPLGTEQELSPLRADSPWELFLPQSPRPFWLVVTGTWLDYFPIYWECHHPNWRSYFSEGFKPPTRFDRKKRLPSGEDQLPSGVIKLGWKMDHRNR